jgi:hypothetical protein
MDALAFSLHENEQIVKLLQTTDIPVDLIECDENTTNNFITQLQKRIHSSEHNLDNCDAMLTSCQQQIEEDSEMLIEYRSDTSDFHLHQIVQNNIYEKGISDLLLLNTISILILCYISIYSI